MHTEREREREREKRECTTSSGADRFQSLACQRQKVFETLGGTHLEGVDGHLEHLRRRGRHGILEHPALVRGVVQVLVDGVRRLQQPTSTKQVGDTQQLCHVEVATTYKTWNDGEHQR